MLAYVTASKFTLCNQLKIMLSLQMIHTRLNFYKNVHNEYENKENGALKKCTGSVVQSVKHYKFTATYEFYLSENVFHTNN